MNLEDELRAEHRDLKERLADIDEKIDVNEGIQKAIMGKYNQDESVEAWVKYAKRYDMKTKFRTDGENYLISMQDFMTWLDDEQRAHEQVDKVYNYSFFEPFGDIVGMSSVSDEAFVCCLLAGHAAMVSLRDGAATVLSDAPDEAWTDLAKGEVNFARSIIGMLPAYVAAATFEVVQRKPKLSVMAKAGFRKKRSAPKLVEYKIIRAVKKIYVGERLKQHLARAEPEHKVPVRGSWRKVKGIGRDENGNPVVGKTWVREHTRWNDKPDPMAKVVWVKEPLSRGP